MSRRSTTSRTKGPRVVDFLEALAMRLLPRYLAAFQRVACIEVGVVRHDQRGTGLPQVSRVGSPAHAQKAPAEPARGRYIPDAVPDQHRDARPGWMRCGPSPRQSEHDGAKATGVCRLCGLETAKELEPQAVHFLRCGRSGAPSLPKPTDDARVGLVRRSRPVDLRRWNVQR